MFNNGEKITNYNLYQIPFLLYLGKIKLPMYKIYKSSNGFKDDLNEFEIEKEKYSIKFQSKSIYTCEMLIYQNKDFKYKYDLLLKPIEIIFNQALNENKSIQDLKSITIIGKKSYNIENKLFFHTTKKYINFKEEVNINEENIIKEIDPHLLSFNFYEIFSDNVKKEKTFKLIQAQFV